MLDVKKPRRREEARIAVLTVDETSPVGVRCVKRA